MTTKEEEVSDNRVPKLRRDQKIDSSILTSALCRNFGGKPALLDTVLKTFSRKCGFESDDSYPKVKDLIASSLADPKARHLMILTHRSSALSILFDLKLLDRKGTTVLVGSAFDADNQELLLIQQINAIKRAMALGNTVVLVNHDAIYEALYDVLNQRYLVRHNEKTKVTQRMLRLAVGTRSQLCPVGDGFKVVLVVEEEHALKNLDLPLLNRFEKQLMLHRHVLTTKQQDLVRALESWIRVIAQESKKALGTKMSLDRLFAGYNEGSMASLVYAYPSLSMDKLKKIVVRVSKPQTILQSKTLQSMATMYWKHHSHIGESLRWQGEQNEIKLHVVLTASPASHLNLAMRAFEVKKHKESSFSSMFANANSCIISLAELNSERDLRQRVHTFLFSTNSQPSIMIVQCDPIVCDSTLIEHARYIVNAETDARGSWSMLSAPDELQMRLTHSRFVPVFPRLVAFVIHLPPALARRERKFPLTFSRQWQYSYIDDIVPIDMLESNGEEILRLSTEEMVKCSVTSLVKKGRIPVGRILRTYYRRVLIRIRAPEPIDVVSLRRSSFAWRLGMLNVLLGSDKSPFFRFAENIVRDVVIEIGDSAKSHVMQALKRRQARAIGSLRHSLESAVLELVLYAFGLFLRRIDRNFNLNILFRSAHSMEASRLEMLDDENSREDKKIDEENSKDEDEKKVVELWFELARHKAIVDWATVSVAASTAVSEGNYANRDMSIANDGQHGVVLSRFPFSKKLLSVLNQPQGPIRSHVESLPKTKQIDAMKSLIVQNFGDKIASLSSQSSMVERYLHDFVAMNVPRYALSFELQLKLYRIVLLRANSLKPLNVASVHVLTWRHEERLHCLSSLLSSLANIQTGSCEAILRKMMKTNDKNSSSLADLDMIVLTALLDSSPLRLKIPTHQNTLFGGLYNKTSDDWIKQVEIARQWTRRVTELAHHVEALLSLTKHETDELRIRWISLRLKKIAVDELLLPSTMMNLMVDMSTLMINALNKREIHKHVYENKTNKTALSKWLRNLFEMTCSIVMQASNLLSKTDSKHEQFIQSMIAHFCRRVLLTLLIDDRDHVFVFEDTNRLLAEIALGRFEMIHKKISDDLTPQQKNVLRIIQSAILNSTSVRRCALQLLEMQSLEILYKFVSESASQRCLDERSVMLLAEHFEDSMQHDRKDVTIESSSKSNDDDDDEKKIEDLSACFNVNEDMLDDPKVILGIRDLGRARHLLFVASNTLGSWLIPAVTECPICSDELGYMDGFIGKLKECNHQFCFECISSSFNYTKSKGYDVTCPMCRAPTNESSIVKMPVTKQKSKPPPENEAAESLLSRKGDMSLSGPNAESWGKWSSKKRWGGRLYLLRSLLHQQGEHALWKLVGSSSKRWEWLKDLPLTAGTSAEDQLGYLAYQSAFGKDYIMTATSIKRAMGGKKGGGDAETLKEMLDMFERVPSQCRLAAVFTQLYIRHTETEKSKALKAELNHVVGEIVDAYASSSSPSVSSKSDGVNFSSSASDEDILFVSMASNYTNCTWLKKNCTTAKFFQLKASKDKGGADVVGQLTVLQTVFHVAALALDQGAQSWMKYAMFDPVELRDVFLPSMAEDYSAALMAAVAKSSKVTKWWQCACGERYAVGDCGRLNQAGHCTACGATIGGQNKHGSTVPTGNSLVTNNGSITLPGYIRLDGESEKQYIKSGGGRKLSPLTVLFFRFVLHSLLAVGAVSSKEGATRLSCLLSPDGKPRDPVDAVDMVVKKLQSDFRMLMDQLNLSIVECSVAIHLCLRKYATIHSMADTILSLRKKQNRMKYEFLVQNHCIQSVMLGKHTNNTVLKEIRRQKKEDSAIRTDDEMMLWEQLRETELQPSLQSRLWRFRQPVSVNHFSKWVMVRANAITMRKSVGSERERRAMRLLAAFVKEEEALPHVKYLPCILRWHRLLFEYLSGGDREISYEQSLGKTNRDFLESLPKDRQQGARLIFDRFCEGYNTVFPSIEMIECHPNTYRNTRMSLDTALAISLPCAKRTQSEGLSPGMCTVALLQYLQQLHNTILLHFQEEALPATSSSNRKMIAAAVAASTRTVKAPAARIRASTPSDLIRRSVIVYSRQKHLSALLDMFSVQPPQYGKGHDLDYDAVRIAESLALVVLAGKAPLELEIREYHFRGEHLRSGHLDSLARHVVQQKLPRRVESVLVDELDTSQASGNFIQILDECVAFIVSTSGRHASGLDAQMLMNEFVLKRMLLPESQWSRVSTPGIRRELRLCHLKHLRDILTKGMRRGDPLDTLSSKYRSELDSKGRLEVQEAQRAAQSLEGHVCRARYKNARGWYRGRIIRDRKNGTFDILYTDGDTWQSVPKRKIRLLVPLEEEMNSKKEDHDGDDDDDDGMSASSSLSSNKKKNIKMKDIGEPTRFRVEVLIPVMREFLLKVIENKIPPSQNLKNVLGVMEVPPAGLRGAVDDPEDFYSFSEIDWYNFYFPTSLRVEHCLTYLRVCEGSIDLEDNVGGVEVESTKVEEEEKSGSD